MPRCTIHRIPMPKSRDLLCCDDDLKEFPYKLVIPCLDIKGTFVEDVLDWLVLDHYKNFMYAHDSHSKIAEIIFYFDSNDLKTEFLLRL